MQRVVDETTLQFTAADGTEVFARVWSPVEGMVHKGIVQIAHGMMEHSGRYRRLAMALGEAGYVVYASDHRGHGHTVKRQDDVGHLELDGLRWVVQDLRHLTMLAREQFPDLPLFLMGHSLGSFIVQQYICQYGAEIDGVVLSGTTGRPGGVIRIASWLARREIRKQGPRHRSDRLHNLTFGSYNKGFAPARTPYDWLSRDEAEVRLYMEDPLCGGTCTAGFYNEFFQLMSNLQRVEDARAIPHNLPIYLFAGDKDPVGQRGKSVSRLASWYRRVGLRDVTCTLYPNGRHEMCNELNREEVTADLISWLDQHVPKDK